MTTFKIYMLSDPSTGEVGYVGITVRSLKSRLSGHLSNGKKEKPDGKLRSAWIQSIVDRGEVPFITLLEESTDPSREVYWIDRLRSSGANLRNSQAGGHRNPPKVKTF